MLAAKSDQSVSADKSCTIMALLDGGTLKRHKGWLHQTWCVAKPSSSLATLLENINFVCAQVNCDVLQKGGACSSPGNVFNHASVTMNLYYQSKGRNTWDCQFGNSGLITVTDPSYGSCPYG